MDTIQWIVTSVLTLGFMGDIVLHFVLRSRRRKDNAEADLAEHDADNAEVNRLLGELDHQEKTIENLLKLNTNLSERLSTLNATIDKHIDRNRELADRAYKSETELNRQNEKLLTVTEERDREKLLKEKFKEWHCRSSICREDNPDPKGRQPPNPKIEGKGFVEPDDE